MNNQSEKLVITAEQVANYVVCPEAWRLKYFEKAASRIGALGDKSGEEAAVRTSEGQQRRKDWIAQQDHSATLRSYAKLVYLLLLALVVIVFLLDPQRFVSSKNLRPDQSALIAQTSIKAVPTEISLLILILGVLIFTWDLFERRRSKIQKQAGLEDKTEMISLKGSSYLPAKEYFSARLALLSRPDCLLKEDGFTIPVDIRPMSSKVRDRHVVSLLLHMHLIKEIDELEPPYGILLIGKNHRRVQIKNTAEKQRWLDALIAEIRSIQEGVPAVPAPSRFKCKNCDVRQICTHKYKNS